MLFEAQKKSVVPPGKVIVLQKRSVESVLAGRQHIGPCKPASPSHWDLPFRGEGVYQTAIVASA
jgi:hypothetical protein